MRSCVVGADVEEDKDGDDENVGGGVLKRHNDRVGKKERKNKPNVYVEARKMSVHV